MGYNQVDILERFFMPSTKQLLTMMLIVLVSLAVISRVPALSNIAYGTAA